VYAKNEDWRGRWGGEEVVVAWNKEVVEKSERLVERTKRWVKQGCAKVREI
jgi:GGDEF domain-containing protein